MQPTPQGFWVAKRKAWVPTDMAEPCSSLSYLAPHSLQYEPVKGLHCLVTSSWCYLQLKASLTDSQDILGFSTPFRRTAIVPMRQLNSTQRSE